jgi:hypothetical protein
MRKKILAASIGAVLVAGFLTPIVSSNAQAQVTSESRVLQAILGLTEHLKWHTEELVDTTENIEEDLLFKKKFYQLDGSPSGTRTIEAVGVEVVNCTFSDKGACAFTLESLQLISQSPIPVTDIIVDGVPTNVTAKDISTSTNLLVDAGIGSVGASRSVIVVLDGNFGNSNNQFEFNGEKPQGMELCFFGAFIVNGNIIKNEILSQTPPCEIIA